MQQGPLNRLRNCRARPSHKRLNRPGNVLQVERATLLKCEVQPSVYMIADGARDTDATRRAFGLEPRSDIHRVPVQISPVSDCIANVDADTEADGPIKGLVAVVDGNLLLHLHRTTHGPVYAIEHNQQGIAARLDDPTVMFTYCWVDYPPAKASQPFEGSSVVKPNQAAVASHISVDHGDQLSPI